MSCTWQNFQNTISWLKTKFKHIWSHQTWLQVQMQLKAPLWVKEEVTAASSQLNSANQRSLWRTRRSVSPWRCSISHPRCSADRWASACRPAPPHGWPRSVAPTPAVATPRRPAWPRTSLPLQTARPPPAPERPKRIPNAWCRPSVTWEKSAFLPHTQDVAKIVGSFPSKKEPPHWNNMIHNSTATSDYYFCPFQQNY